MCRGVLALSTRLGVLVVAPVVAPGCQFSSATGAQPSASTEESGTAESSGATPRPTSTGIEGESTSEPRGDGDSAHESTTMATPVLGSGSSSGDGSTGAGGNSTGTTGDGVVTDVYCGAPALAIPDDDAGGLATQIAVPDAGAVIAVRLGVDISHTFVGDLRVDLRHGDADRIMINRPGGGGCDGDDIAVLLRDDADMPVESSCTSSIPALTGELRPEYSLDVFVGAPMFGTWELRVTDDVMNDTGMLAGWCLEIDHLT